MDSCLKHILISDNLLPNILYTGVGHIYSDHVLPFAGRSSDVVGSE